MKSKLLFAILAAGAVVGSIVLLLVFRDDGTALSAPLLAIAGLFIVVVTIAITAGVFGQLRVLDRTQPLAMPTGSVRALVALFLLVVFVVLVPTTLTNLSNGRVTKLEAVSSSELPRLMTAKDFTVIQREFPDTASARDFSELQASLSRAAANHAEMVIANTDPKTIEAAKGKLDQAAANLKRFLDSSHYTVTLRSEPSDTVTQISRDLLAQISILVTSVVAFYFGSRSAQQGSGDTTVPAEGNATGTVIASVAPTRLQTFPTPTGLTITGNGLDAITAIGIGHPDTDDHSPLATTMEARSATSISVKVIGPTEDQPPRGYQLWFDVNGQRHTWNGTFDRA